MVDDEWMDIHDELEALRDPVTGRKGKTTMSSLNKRKLSQWEMDEIFCEEEA
ncbi:MAG: hypothetical protein ABIA93_00460 [Candidatus Woesearchaeota archaeon]